MVVYVSRHYRDPGFIEMPDRVKGFIISDAIIFPVDEYRKVSVMLGILSTPVFKFFNKRLNILIRSLLMRGVNNRPLSQAEKNGYLEVFADGSARNRIALVLASLKSDPAILQGVKASFETIFNHKPALLINGEHDPLVDFGVPARINDMLKNATLRFIKGEAHFPYEGEPESIAAMIDQWINHLNQHNED